MHNFFAELKLKVMRAIWNWNFETGLLSCWLGQTLLSSSFSQKYDHQQLAKIYRVSFGEMVFGCVSTFWVWSLLVQINTIYDMAYLRTWTRGERIEFLRPNTNTNDIQVSMFCRIRTWMSFVFTLPNYEWYLPFLIT